MCVVRSWSQKVTLSLQCLSQILGSRTAESISITNYASDSQTQTKTNSEWINHVGSMLPDSLDSDADADVNVVIVLRQWLNQLRKYSGDTSKLSL